MFQEFITTKSQRYAATYDFKYVRCSYEEILSSGLVENSSVKVMAAYILTKDLCSVIPVSVIQLHTTEQKF